LHLADDDKESVIRLHGRYRTGSMLGSHMCSAPLCRTKKSLWEHYNELTAKLDATQETEWNDMANTILIFVRLPFSLSIRPLNLNFK